MHAPAPSPTVPRVFISYSWDSEEHKEWVLAFAHELVAHGLDVLLDRWHLHEGDDKTYFMEQAVTKSDFVLVICTPAYALKANERRGGVGYEGMIITSAIADSLLTDKFIPVLRAGERSEATPIWLGNRIGPDLRGTDYPVQVFESLLRKLYNETVKPPVPGPRPVFQQPTPQRLVFSSPAHQESSAPLELPPAAEEFFGRESERLQLVARLRERRNTAIVGDAGLGKTALAAQAIREVIGETQQTLAASPYPDGVLFLDFYTLEGSAERAWDTLANRLGGPDFLAARPSMERARAVAAGRRFLLVVEGAEEANGRDGHPTVPQLLGVLAPENRYLLLSRVSDLIDPAEMVTLSSTLEPENAARLFDSLTAGTVTGEPRAEALRLLDGHPLALTWAAKRLRYADDAPEAFLAEWKAARLPGLSDPRNAQHTLGWLYGRSVRGLSAEARQALAAAAMLNFAPLPWSAIAAALQTHETGARELLRLLTRHALLRPAGSGSWQFTHVLGYSFARQEVGAHAALRPGLGRWLDTQLTQALAQVETPGTLSIGRLLEHLDALLRTEDSQGLWRPLVEDALYDFSDRLVILGRLAQARALLGMVEWWFEQIPAGQRGEPFWQREKSTLFDRVGNILKEQGGLDAALRSFRDSLEIRQRLAQDNPSSDQAQRDLSISFEKVGSILQEQGDLDSALRSFRDSLQIRQRLAQTDPSSALAQRDLSISFDNVGNVLKEQGDLDAALRSFRESLQIHERLAQADPSSALAQRDLSVSFNNVGNILKEQGDLDAALRSFRDSLQTREQLAQADPSSALAQRDLSISFDNLGNILREQGDLDAALRSFRDSLQISQRLAQADPSSAQALRDLSISLNKVGEILKEQGDLDAALRSFRDSLHISQRLAQADPSSAQAQRDLAYTLTQLAVTHEKQGHPMDALPFARESLRIAERLATLDRTNVTWRNDVQFSRSLVSRLTDQLEPAHHPPLSAP